ncbi:gltJ [Wigglesworthia glossinidia endosymbiont of Glossina brevipalpis]|uniref:GltJ protein n=1 Tax=Wigglesworthia glossinidia brevipalpis TaxID=36870 RepID=Q8D312_WIGBR|nr:gltJ [Wigglesworthia glossinidia endosymbiont of Glossina brevipalpis]
MNLFELDWYGIIQKESFAWIIIGLFNTLFVTIISIFFSTIFTAFLFFLKQSLNKFFKFFIISLESIIRNTPILVQLFFWYFSVWNKVSNSIISIISSSPSFTIFSNIIYLFTSELICSIWSLSIFSSVYLVEELQTGLNAISKGQKDAAKSQGFKKWYIYKKILIPQGIKNAWQPMIGQYLNLLKLSSLTSAIGFGELTYSINQIESYNAHAIEAFAVGTFLYLILGYLISKILSCFLIK